MATLQTADGRLLKSSRPAGPGFGSGSLLPGSFPPMWSSGEREPNGLTDSLDGNLVSYEQIYRSQPVLAGVIDKIARRAATLPFGAYTEDPKGFRESVDRTDSLATLIRRPRPRTSTVHLLTHVFQSLYIHGNALVAKLRGPDRDAPPVMLWPINWATVNAYGEQGGDIEWWSFPLAGEERFIAAADTIHFAWPGPDGGMVGVSPLEKLGITVQLEDASQRFQRANFRNGNRPSLAISLEQPNPKKELLDLTRASIENLHKGVDRAGKTILLGAGAKVQTLSMSPVEAALIDQRRLNREEVAIVFDLAGPSLSDTTDSSLGNVVERNRAFYRDVLPPYTTLVVETFEAQLLDQEPAWLDRVVRFDFTDKLRGEPKEQAETLKTLTEGGLLSRDEGREQLGKPPKGGAAAELTANVNNQAPVNAMDAASDTPPGGVTPE